MNEFILGLAGFFAGIAIFASCVNAGQYSPVWGVFLAIFWMVVAYVVVGVGIVFWAYAGTQILLFLFMLILRAFVRK